jgi:hypothetical protein
VQVGTPESGDANGDEGVRREPDRLMSAVIDEAGGEPEYSARYPGDGDCLNGTPMDAVVRER